MLQILTKQGIEPISTLMLILGRTQSGKTKTMIDESINMINHYDIDNVYLISPSNNQDEYQRLQDTIDYQYDELNSETINAIIKNQKESLQKGLIIIDDQSYELLRSTQFTSEINRVRHYNIKGLIISTHYQKALRPSTLEQQTIIIVKSKGMSKETFFDQLMKRFDLDRKDQKRLFDKYQQLPHYYSLIFFPPYSQIWLQISENEYERFI